MNSAQISSDFETQILEESLQLPRAAVMRLSIEIDRQMRLILGAIGRLRSYRGGNPVEALALVENSTPLPKELKDAVNRFWELRNSIVHGPTSGENQAIQAIDYGLRVLRMLTSIPRPAYIVRFAGVPLYMDSDCRRMLQDVSGVILESFGFNGESFGLHIHPSTITYVPGQSLTWEWGMEPGAKSWNETWYRDPKTSEIKSAWSSSLEFVGRALETI